METSPIPTITRIAHDDSDYVTDFVHHPFGDAKNPIVSKHKAVALMLTLSDSVVLDPYRFTLRERITHLLTVIQENHNERLADDGVGTLNDILVSQIKQIIKELT
jgi:hypothetical protein